MARLSANHQRPAGVMDQADLKVGLYDSTCASVRWCESCEVRPTVRGAIVPTWVRHASVNPSQRLSHC